MKITISLLLNLIGFIALRYLVLINAFLLGYGSSDKYIAITEMMALTAFLLQMIVFYFLIRKRNNKTALFLIVLFTLSIIYVLDLLGYIPFLRS